MKCRLNGALGDSKICCAVFCCLVKGILYTLGIDNRLICALFNPLCKGLPDLSGCISGLFRLFIKPGKIKFLINGISGFLG